MKVTGPGARVALRVGGLARLGRGGQGLGASRPLGAGASRALGPGPSGFGPATSSEKVSWSEAGEGVGDG